MNRRIHFRTIFGRDTQSNHYWRSFQIVNKCPQSILFTIIQNVLMYYSSPTCIRFCREHHECKSSKSLHSRCYKTLGTINLGHDIGTEIKNSSREMWRHLLRDINFTIKSKCLGTFVLLFRIYESFSTHMVCGILLCFISSLYVSFPLCWNVLIFIFGWFTFLSFAQSVFFYYYY